MRKILLCSQWVSRFQPLVRELLTSGRYEIYCEEDFVRNFGAQHAALKSYQPFIPPPDAQKIERESRQRLAVSAKYLVESAPRFIPDFTAYSGVKDVQRIVSALRESLGQILYMNQAFRSLCSTLSPDLLIVDGPGLRQQTWLATAKTMKVPSLEIYHAILAVKPELLFRRHDQADYLAMGSSIVKDAYLQLGVPEGRMRVTGFPMKSDGGYHHDEAVGKLSQKYALDPQKKIVLLFNQYDSGDAFEFLFNLSTGYQVDLLKQVCSTVKSLDSEDGCGVQLIVKRHPTMVSAGWDDEKAYHYIASKEGLKIVMVDPKESNPLLLAACDVVVAFKVSSTISETLNADRPVIMFPYTRQWLHDEILQSGAIIPVEDSASFLKALRLCLYDPDFQREYSAERRSFLDKHSAIKADEAVDNIVKYISDILNIRTENQQTTMKDETLMPEQEIKSAARNISRPIKVLHITDCLSKGGAGRGLIGVAKYSSKLGHFRHECISVKPLFDGVVSEGVTEGLVVHNAPNLEQIQSLIESADVVHWHWWEDFPLMRVNLPRKPTIVWCAVSGEYPPNELTREVVDFADIMVITNPMTRDLPAIRSLPESERQRKVRLIFESADFDRILPLEKIHHETFNVGWIGTISSGKYNPRYIKMSSQINIPNVRFMICGEGPQKKAATEETVHLGVQNRFQFLGYQDDMRKMFGLFDVYGFPLDEKTFAGGELNLQEAMVAGLPIVIFPYGGPKRMILHNYNGLIAYSEKEYIEAIEFLYHHPEERERLGKNARDYALREFGADKAAEKFNRLYEELTPTAKISIKQGVVQNSTKGDESESWRRLARFHFEKGDCQKALSYAEQILTRSPQDAEMLELVNRQQKKGNASKIEPIKLSNTDDVEKSIDTRKFSSYKVTAIVSTYASEDVFAGCLTDLFNQSLYQSGDLEIIIVDAASPQGEWNLIEQLAAKKNNVLALRTQKRESLYAAWNRAIRLSRGRYITNANADDRHRKDALEILAKALDDHPEAALAYGDVLITKNPNETFEKNTEQDAFRWGQYSREKLEDHCCVGPQPMWRSSLHKELGTFDERYVSAGDYDFWLRISLKYPMIHLDEILGLYLDNPQSLEHKGIIGERERVDVLNSHYMRKQPPLQSQPLVSIIIPTYNRSQLLKHTLISLIEQTYPNWEALVVNDGGEPLTLVEKDLPVDERIRVINLPENHERSYCRNLGFRESCGKYIAFLDDDDIFYRHHLEIAVNTLENSEKKLKVFYSASHRARAKMENGELQIENLQRLYGSDFDRNRLLVSNYIPILALVFERSVLEDRELFDEELNCLEDYDFLIRIAHKYDFCYINLITHEFRTFSDLSIDELKRHRQIYERLHEKHSDLRRGDWKITWKQRDWLREMDLMIFHKEENPLRCAIIMEADRGPGDLLSRVDRIGRETVYRNLEMCFLITESDTSSQKIIRNSAWKKNLILVPAGSSLVDSALNAAMMVNSELMVFLDSGCVPTKRNWLSELIEVYQREGAGILSSLIVNNQSKDLIRDASLARGKNSNGIRGIYQNLLYYHPILQKVRSVDAVGPGILLISREDFIEAGGFDRSLPKALSWMDLCLWMRVHKRKQVLLNPYSMGAYINRDGEIKIEVSAEDADKIFAKWGKECLRNAGEWYVEDGFWEYNQTENEVRPAYHQEYDELCAYSDHLIMKGRTSEAGLIREAIEQIYPEEERNIPKSIPATRRIKEIESVNG